MWSCLVWKSYKCMLFVHWTIEAGFVFHFHTLEAFLFIKSWLCSYCATKNQTFAVFTKDEWWQSFTGTIGIPLIQLHTTTGYWIQILNCLSELLIGNLSHGFNTINVITCMLHAVVWIRLSKIIFISVSVRTLILIWS